MLKFAVALVSLAVTTQAQETPEEWTEFYDGEYGGRLNDYIDSQLCESGTVGYQGENDFSNLGELLNQDYHRLSVHKITSCEDDEGHWIGTQLTLQHNDGSEVALQGLGTTTGKCQTLTLTGDIDALKAGFNDDEGDGAVKSIRFLKDGVTKTYGELTRDQEAWQFTSENRFMGLHGSTQDGVVVGFSVISDMGEGGFCPHKEQVKERIGFYDDPANEAPDSSPPSESDEPQGPTEESKEPQNDSGNTGGGSGNNQKCDCLSDNDIDQVKRGGQKVILYTDGEGNEYEYPVSYGTQCIAWDEVLPPYCGDENQRPLDDAPRWCSQPWCYVDQDCDRNDVEYSGFFGDDYELWYSYGNCDAQDYLSDEGDWYEPEEEEVVEDTTAEAETGSGATSMAFATAMMAVTSMLFM